MCGRCGCVGSPTRRCTRGTAIEGALEAGVLIACADAPRYGYEIASWLTSEGLAVGPISPGRLYETLGRLSRAGALTSISEPSTRGPARRRYTLTAEGRERLHAWITSLTHSGAVLARLLTHANRLEEDPAFVGPPSSTARPQGGGEPMPCNCNCQGNGHRRGDVAHREQPSSSRSIEERLSTIEELLASLTLR